MRGWRKAGRLFYRDTCPRCRRLSRLALLLALGRIRRVPLGSPEAEALVRAGRLQPVRVGFVWRGGTALGRGVVPAIAAAVLTTPLWTASRRGSASARGV
ncbi:MAG TPA: hypothetical protein VHG08_18365 [Longimicrobium sp.]|nr:hypothetical protein [Longimicrobium sp.]